MRSSLLFVAVVATLAMAACKPQNNTDAATQTPSTAATSDDAAPAQDAATSTMAAAERTPSPDATMGDANSGDGLALGLLAAVDENEIAAARQAQEKQVSGAVLDYARMMETEHSKNLEQTRTLGTLSDAADVQAVKDKGAGELKALGEKSGKAYAAAYIDAMIAGHKDALTMIDGKMMGAAKTEPVTKHLTETRGHVEQHLAKAEAIKKSM